MKLNRRGFTLVELLVTIVIVGLVVGFTVFGIVKLTKDSENKTLLLSEDNLKEAARIYSTEASSESWKKNDKYEFDAFCTTIGELMNKGFLDKNSSIVGDYTKDSYIIVKRNKVTLAIDSEEFVPNIIDNEYNQICTGQVSNEGNIIKPEINNYVSYTDRIEISFDEGNAPESSVKDYKCLYGESSSNVSNEGVIEGNKCILDGLRNNKQYYVFIYMNTNKGSSVLAEGSREYITKDFVDTTFVQNGNKVNISYKNDNIYGEGYHYFKSGISGTSSESVISCDLDNNKYICNESTNLIEKDRWYRVDTTSVNITYPEETNKFNIDTKICDDSNNCKDKNLPITINKYVVKFYRNGAVNVDGSTNEYIEKYCIAGENGSCNISSPSFTSQVGYSVVGWNRSNSATSSEWNVGTTKNINSNLNYYAISRINKVYIRYNVNGGQIATSSNDSGIWTKNSSGTILLNGSVLTYSLNYGGTLSSSGLANYNNSSYLNISREGYSAVSKEEWICLSGDCKGKTYNHATSYSASDFCDATSSDCTVELGVNWRINKVYINYNVNGGKLATTSNETGKWTKNSSGTILLNGSVLTASLNYGANIGENGLTNYNNKNVLNISREGYRAVSGEEWKCLSGNCKQKTYSHDKYSVTGYTSDSFCDASNGDCTVELGVNWNVNKVNIKYNVNGGNIATTSNDDGTWTKNSSGTVLLNDSVLTASLNYGGTLSSSGLANYNNSSYINISRTGYSAVKGEEWKCLSGDCKGKTYNHATSYSASDFCDATSSDCTVELGVNWRINKVYINYNVNGGNIATTSNDYGAWAQDSNGSVLLNGSNLTTIIDYGSAIRTSGLDNWDSKTILNISKTGYSAVTGEEWKCLSGNCKRETYNDLEYDITGYTAADFCDASNSDCTVELGVNWRKNKVYINYNVNGGSIATVSNSRGTWTSNSDGTVLLNDSFYTASIVVGGALGSSGLANYNNSEILNISRTGYTAVSGMQWKCISGNCKQETYSQSTAYSADDFCDASSSDCTVELGVNWIVSSYPVNETKFTYNSAKKITVYYFDTCTSSTNCSYNKVNGLSNSGNFSGTSYTLDELIKKLSTSSKYFKNDSVACYSGASTSSSKSYTFKKCVNNAANSISVWETTTSGWYYSKNKGCYLLGSDLTSTRPTSCSSSSTCKYTCVKNSANIGACDNLGGDWGAEGKCYKYNQTSCGTGWEVYEKKCS